MLLLLVINKLLLGVGLIGPPVRPETTLAPMVWMLYQYITEEVELIYPIAWLIRT